MGNAPVERLSMSLMPRTGERRNEGSACGGGVKRGQRPTCFRILRNCTCEHWEVRGLSKSVAKPGELIHEVGSLKSVL